LKLHFKRTTYRYNNWEEAEEYTKNI